MKREKRVSRNRLTFRLRFWFFWFFWISPAFFHCLQSRFWIVLDFLDFTDVFCFLCLIDKNALGPSLSKMPLDVKQWTCANLVPIRTSEWCQFGSPNGADSDVRMVPIRTSKWCQFGRPNGANSDVRMVPVRTAEWCQFGRPNDNNLSPGRGKRGHQNDGSANALKQMSEGPRGNR